MDECQLELTGISAFGVSYHFKDKREPDQFPWIFQVDQMLLTIAVIYLLVTS